MRTRTVTLTVAVLIALGTAAPPDTAGGMPGHHAEASRASSAPTTGPTTTAARSTKAPRYISFARWGASSFRDGTYRGATGSRALVVGRHPSRTTYRDPFGSSRRRSYDRGTWSSPWQRSRFGLGSAS